MTSFCCVLIFVFFLEMTKKQRQLIFDKYNGRCAYCGCELQPGWHVDHLKPIRRHLRKDGCRHPKRDCVENCMPACASCNINKHSMSLEEFRKLVGGFIKSLNRDSTQYKIAKRYGFVVEVEKPVVFYFEQQSAELNNMKE